MRLKIYLLPLIMQEVDAVTEKFINLINVLRVNDDPESNTEFLNMRAEITKRIEQLEQFFEENIRDTRVAYIEKARIKLKKLLMYDPDVLNKMQSQNNHDMFDEEEVKQKEVNVLYFNKKKESSNTEATERASSPNNANKKISAKAVNNVNINRTVNVTISSTTNKPNLKANAVHRETAIKQTISTTIDKDSRGVNIQKKVLSDRKVVDSVKTKLSNVSAGKNKLSSVSPKKVSEFQSKLSQQVPPEEDNFISSLISHAVFDNNFDENNWKEISFKLKLTDNEYKTFIKEKANNINLK